VDSQSIGGGTHQLLAHPSRQCPQELGTPAPAWGRIRGGRRRRWPGAEGTGWMGCCIDQIQPLPG
ncbi:MAG: hypothetical protein ACK559_08260, partial [bacterium]